MQIKGIGILGIFLVATFFSCGCIDTPSPEIIEVDRIVATPTPTLTPTPSPEIIKVIEETPEINEMVDYTNQVIDVIESEDAQIIAKVITLNPTVLVDMAQDEEFWEAMDSVDEDIEELEKFLGLEDTYTLSELSTSYIEKLSMETGISIEDIKNNRHQYTIEEIKEIVEKYNLGEQE